MFKYFSKILSEDFIIKMKFLPLLMVFVFCSMPLLRESKHLGLGYLEFALLALTNHYYLLFLFFIVFLLTILNFSKNESELCLIRSNSYANFFVLKVLALAEFSIVYVMLHLIVILVIGLLNLPGDNAFTLINECTSNSDLLILYSEHFMTPAHTLLAIVGYMILGLTFISILIHSITKFTDRKVSIVVIIIMYISMVFALNKGTDRFVPYFYFNNYFILHHALTKGITMQLIGILAVVSLLIFYTVKKKRRWNQ